MTFPPSSVSVLTEALALGFASGSACLASCGVPLLPWLARMQRGWRGTVALLGVFLGGRLGGYLVFGLAVGLAGHHLDLKGPTGLLLAGLTSLAVAVLLGIQAWRGHGLKRREEGCQPAKGYTLERRYGMAGLALLGLFTGLNICGPFVAATLRAAQVGGPLSAMVFFAVFFLGTAVWMLPLALAGAFREVEACLMRSPDPSGAGARPRF
jgi:sulfite exporter TauE/SafE